MNVLHRRAPRLSILMLLSLALAACNSGQPAGQATTAPATTAPTTAATTAATTAPTTAATTAAATEAPTTAGGGNMNDKVLVLGDTQSPDTLYGLESNSLATTNVLQALGGGTIGNACYTSLSYDYQPICFPEFPTLESGGAVTKTVQIDPASISPEKPIVVGGLVYTSTKDLADVPVALDQFVVTWKLRPDLKWEDGQPLTAEDFVFGYTLAKDPGTKTSSRYLIDRTWSFRAVDATTLEWTGAPGYSEATYFLNFYPPYPKHALQDKKPSEIGGSDYANHPLSFGPYMIKEYKPSEQVTLVANPNYFRAKEGLPKVGTVIFKFISAQDQLLAQLESGDIDYAGTIGLTLAQTESLNKLEGEKKIAVQYVPGTVWEHIDFGIDRGDKQSSFFKDVKVRQAMAYGINRKQIIDSVLFGKTVTMNSFIPADHWAYPPNGEGLNSYDYSPDKAKALLAEAGYKAGADGILEKDGTPFKITLYTTENNATRQASSEIIQQNLKDLGIQVDLQFVPGPAKLFKVGADGVLRSRNFDMALYAWVASPEPSVDLYFCSQIPTPENSFAGQNSPGYCNPDYDKVAVPARSETDRAKRIPLVIEAEKIFNNDLPTLPLYQRVKIAATGTKVSGPKINATQISDTYNIEEWDISE